MGIMIKEQYTHSSLRQISIWEPCPIWWCGSPRPVGKSWPVWAHKSWFSETSFLTQVWVRKFIATSQKRVVQRYQWGLIRLVVRKKTFQWLLT